MRSSDWSFFWELIVPIGIVAVVSLVIVYTAGPS